MGNFPDLVLKKWQGFVTQWPTKGGRGGEGGMDVVSKPLPTWQAQ